MLDAIKHCMTGWRDFRGRTSRRHFWLFFLFLFLINIPASIIEAIIMAENGNIRFNFGVYLGFDTQASWWQNIFTLIFAFPLLASIVRRFHDAGFRSSGIAVFCLILLAVNTFIGKAFGFVPVSPTIMFGFFFLVFAILIYLLTRPSEVGPNLYGPNPNEVPS